VIEVVNSFKQKYFLTFPRKLPCLVNVERDLAAPSEIGSNIKLYKAKFKFLLFPFTLLFAPKLKDEKKMRHGYGFCPFVRVGTIKTVSHIATASSL
jgi:hypothetical protein